MRFLDVNLKDKTITLCGNYGDPIYHPNLLEMILQFKQQGANVSIHTNGSYQKSQWWENLVTVLDHNDTIIFGIDGIPENFTQYRVNADWKSIHAAMQISAAAKCKTVWRYILFSYNQNSIESAKTLSEQIGIDTFKVELSDRFDSKTDYLKPTDDLLGSRYKSQPERNTNFIAAKINAQCNNGQEHYISADGFYSSCCLIADHRFYYKNTFGKDKAHYDINNSTLSKLLESTKVIEFYQNLESNSTCQFFCPATSQKN